MEQLAPSATTIGPVELRVPADAVLSRVLRLAASGLVSMAEFSIDEIEDVKIAVSEVLIALIEHGDGEDVDLRFEVVGDGDGDIFMVHGSTAVTLFDPTHPDLVLCRTVLSSIANEHGINVHDGTATIWATVRHQGTS